MAYPNKVSKKMKTSILTIALLSTGAAFSLALGAAIPKISSAAIPLGAALGGGAIALVLSEGELRDRAENYPSYPSADRGMNTTDYPSADRANITPPSSHGIPAIFGQPPLSPELKSGTLIFVGAQGSGKSTSAVMVLHERVSNGARGIVFNHHAPYGHYQGLEIFGKGETFQDRFLSLESGMRMVIAEIERRYHLIQTEPNPIFHPMVILMDEMSSWEKSLDSKLCEKFIRLCLTDTRKAKITTIWIVHNLTKSHWGGVDGVAELVRSSGTIIYLSPTPNEAGTDMVSNGYAVVSFGGEKRKIKLAGFLPNITDDLSDFTRYGATKQHQIGALEAAYNLPATAEKSLPEIWQKALNFLRESSPARVRDFQRNKDFRSLSADEIRAILSAMASEQLIDFDGNEAVIS